MLQAASPAMARLVSRGLRRHSRRRSALDQKLSAGIDLTIDKR